MKNLLNFTILLIITTSGYAQADEDCLMCHSDESLTGLRKGKEISMYVNGSILKNSAHKDLDCISCHFDLSSTDYPHIEDLKDVNCNECHAQHQESVANDIHSRLPGIPSRKKPVCKSCHETHNIKSLNSISNKQKAFCSGCHKENVLAGSYHLKSENNQICKECHEEHYYSELHGSVHKNLYCSNCHSHIASNVETHIEEPEKNISADCYLCHNQIASEHKESIHGISIASGIGEAANCWSCHGSHGIIPVNNDSSVVRATNIKNVCASCHEDSLFSQKFSSTVKEPCKMYSTSVHGILVEVGDTNSATCVSCHGIHNIKNRVQEGSKISSVNIPETCGECHNDITEEYKKSIHWIAVKKGVRNSPTCNDCHSEHHIHAINTDKKREEIQRLQEETCLDCHQNMLLAERYSLEADNAKNYQDSYHGLAVRRGYSEAALCVDCHGVHSILPKYHQESSVHESNVVATCKKCHEDANLAFSKSYSHSSSTNLSVRKIEHIVKSVYFWLIVIIIGSMLIHNLIIYLNEIREKSKKEKHEIRIPRLTKNELIQHTILLVSFTILAITGFMLKAPNSFWAEWLTKIGVTELVRQNIHRTAAVIMILLAVYHIIYLIATHRGRFIFISILPRFSDLKMAFQNIMYNLKLSKTHPRFDNFNYIEKIEYWALIWGTLIMGISGFILWFPTMFSNMESLWSIKVSEIVHYYEAILASLAILVWHLFFVMFRPKEYPVNLAVVHGKITLTNFKEEYRLRFYKVVKDWEMLKSDNGKNKIGHFSEIFFSTLSKNNIDIDQFFKDEIDRNEDLRMYIENKS